MTRVAHGVVRSLLLGAAFLAVARRSFAQSAQPVSRAEAMSAALSRGARVALARADTAAARAALLTARAFENPTLSGTYSTATPRWHVLVDLPVAYPWIRGARIGSARAAGDAARYRFAFEHAAAALDADTTYTRALAALSHLRLSNRTAQDADSLRRMAVQRRDAGDAAQLDVELATVNAGQQANIAASDSLGYFSALLDLQAAMGMQFRDVAIVLTDSLEAPPDIEPLGDADSVSAGDAAVQMRAAAAGRGQAESAVPLQVAAAAAAARGAALATTVQRRSVWLAPTITAGFETGDPSGSEPGVLPTIGIGLPLPLFSRNQGPLAQARAEQARASAELQLARVESQAAIARGRRQLQIALVTVQRDRALVAAAARVAAMSLAAYREGASGLPNVLEAQRSAREVVARYADDLAQAWIAAATLRVLTLTPASTRPR